MTKYFNFEVNNMKKIEMYVNTPAKGKLPEQFNDENYKKVQEYHKSLAVYEPTPLVSLDALAEELGVKAVYLKDESKRFGLNAFKALGASYAVGNILKNMDPDKTPVFVTATDGNHGRAVAWAAAQAGYKSVVFMPKGTAQCRVDAIHQVSDAEVTVTDLNYDDAVRLATAYAKEHNGYLVQDTGFEGYEEIPWDITLGYTHMAAEAADQLGGITPTHVFLQAGVGSMAGGVLGYLTDRYGSGSFFCDAVLRSAKENQVEVWVSRDPLRATEPCSVFFPGSNTLVEIKNGENDDTKERSTKIINMERFIPSPRLGASKACLKQIERTRNEFIKTVLKDFENVRDAHFGLEKIYGRAMDFKAVTKYTKELSKTIFS